MRTAAIKLSLDFNQLLDLIRQLSRKEKIKLSKELEKETLDYQLTLLLKNFKTDKLSQEIIDQEVEMVRAKLYAEQKSK